MKKYISSFFAAAVLLTGCVDLDLNPLSEGSSENWYTSEQEIALSLNDLYRPALWYMECTRLYNTDRFTDDWNQRTQLYDWVAGTIDGTAGICTTSWSNSYKMIARANEIIEKIERTRGTMSDQQRSALERAVQNDGKVSRSDYERAWSDYRQCIVDKGYSVPELQRYSSGVYALPSYDTSKATREQTSKLSEDLMTSLHLNKRLHVVITLLLSHLRDVILEDVVDGSEC